VEDKQRKLTTKGKDRGKKVVFRLSEEKLEKKKRMRVTEICNEIIGKEIKGLEEERRIVKKELRIKREN